MNDGTEKRLTIRFDPAIASSTGKPSPDFEENVIRNNPIPWDARGGQQIAMDFDFDGLTLGGYPGSIVWHWHDLKAYQRMFATKEYFVIQLGGYSEGLANITGDLVRIGTFGLCSEGQRRKLPRIERPEGDHFYEIGIFSRAQIIAEIEAAMACVEAEILTIADGLK